MAVDFVVSDIVYRPVEKHEQQQALDLWYSVFQSKPGVDERYFSPDASPHYQHGDTLGAWYQHRLVSTVHIHRLTLRSRENNEAYRCSGIANVGTAPEYRNRGLSRTLLRMAVDRMANDAFDISMLGTGRHKHYLTLGWEQVPEPIDVTIDWKAIPSCPSDVPWRSAAQAIAQDADRLLDIYSHQPRAWQIDRAPLSIFQHWVQWEWQSNAAIVCTWTDGDAQGYVVIGQPDNETDVCVLEWRAPNLDLERTLLSLAAAEVRRRHGPAKAIRLHTLPQYMTLDQLTQWAGPVQTRIHHDSMMRNIRLPDEVYESVKTAYCEGRAAYWVGDYF